MQNGCFFVDCWGCVHSHNAQLVSLRGVLQISSTVLFFQMRNMRVNGRLMKSPPWGVMKKILDLKMKSLMSPFVQRVLRYHFVGLSTCRAFGTILCF